MGFMGQKKFGDGRKNFFFKVRFSGGGTQGAKPPTKSQENKKN